VAKVGDERPDRARQIPMLPVLPTQTTLLELLAAAARARVITTNPLFLRDMSFARRSIDAS
jgi:hypothetical protein